MIQGIQLLFSCDRRNKRRRGRHWIVLIAATPSVTASPGVTSSSTTTSPAVATSTVASPSGGIRETRLRVSRAITDRASRHRPHSRRSCFVSTRHDLLPFFVLSSRPATSTAMSKTTTTAAAAGHQERLFRQLIANKCIQYLLRYPAGIGDDPHARRDEHRLERPGNRAANQDLHAEFSDELGSCDVPGLFHEHLRAPDYAAPFHVYERKSLRNVENGRDPVSQYWYSHSHNPNT